MDDNDIKLLSHRMTQRPCRYMVNPLATERQGIIVGIDPGRKMVLVQDSYTGEKFNVPASLVKEVALFGPEDMPAEKYLKGYFS